MKDVRTDRKTVTLIGGMDRLDRHYRQEAEKAGVNLKIFTRFEGNMDAKLLHSDALILFTNKISHQARNKVLCLAKAQNIQLFMFHTCGVCTLRECLDAHFPRN